MHSLTQFTRSTRWGEFAWVGAIIFEGNFMVSAGLSVNILSAGDKSPVQIAAGDLLPALGFLGGLYNFCNYIFFNVSHTDMEK